MNEYDTDDPNEWFPKAEGYRIFPISIAYMTRTTGSVYFGALWRKTQTNTRGVNLPKGIYQRNGKAEQIMRLIVQGEGTRSIIRATNSTGRTVRRYRDILQKITGTTFNCQCGKPAAHQDHCIYKLSGGHKTQ